MQEQRVAQQLYVMQNEDWESQRRAGVRAGVLTKGMLSYNLLSLSQDVLGNETVALFVSQQI